MTRVGDVQKDLDINIRSELNDFIMFKMGEKNITDMKSPAFDELAESIKQDVCEKIVSYYSAIDEVVVELTADSMRSICSSISR